MRVHGLLLLMIVLTFSNTTIGITENSSLPDLSMQQYAKGYYDSDPIPDKVAYLTFDDGPSDWTSNILDILKKEKIQATFFICGGWAKGINAFEKYRDVLIRMMVEGHTIGNHTLNHNDLAELTADQIAQQIDDNQSLFNQELKGYARQMTLIRPPFGSPFELPASDEARRKVGGMLQNRGIVILWSKHFDSTDSMEWVRGEWYKNGPKINMNDEEFKAKMHRIYERLISRANGKGIVILFHDTHPTTMDILSAIIDKLKTEGYHFGTMEDYVQWRWKKSSAQIIAEQNGLVFRMN